MKTIIHAKLTLPRLVFLALGAAVFLDGSALGAQDDKAANGGAVNPSGREQVDFSRKMARGKELLLLKTREKELDDIYKSATKDYINSDFEKAIGKYLEVRDRFRDLLSEILRLEGVTWEKTEEHLRNIRGVKAVDRLKDKILKCEQAVSKSYYYWAQTIYFEAEKSASKSDFELAIEKCKKAIEVYPACKEEMEKVIKRYESLRDKADENAALNEKIDNKENVRRIEILARQGEILYRDGQWDKARAKFEQIIAIDPYNENAINYLRKIGLQLVEAGRRRMDVVHSERVVEAGWSALTPIIAYDSKDNTTGLLGNEGADKSPETNKLLHKLRTITIQNLEFDDTPISAVIATLRQQSKDLDPEKKGINIVALGKINPSIDPSGDVANAESATKKEDGKADALEIANVNLVVSNPITLERAITLICDRAKLRYKINLEDNIVEIASQDYELDDMETRFFELQNTLSPEKVMQESATKDIHETYFSAIKRPPGAFTAYDPVAGRLIVTNTPENIKAMEKVIEKINKAVPQILITAKFVEVILKDLEELGFQYTFSRQNSNVQYADAGDLKKYTYVGSGTVSANSESMTFDRAQSIYTQNKETGKWEYFGTSNTLPYTTSNKQVINPATGTLASGSGSSTTSGDVAVPYYYKEAVIGKKDYTWGPNNKLVRVFDADGSPTTEVNTDVNFGKVWEFDAYNKKGYGLNAQVYALDQAGASDILYCPRITTKHGVTANMDMVLEKYYPESWEDAELTTMDNIPILVGSTPELEEQEEGILFSITPELDMSEEPNYETINLQFNQLEIIKFVGWDDYSYDLPTDDGTGNYVNIPNIIRTPIFQQRTVDTAISCVDNSTIVIGGMVTDESSVVNDKYPILGDLPIIGRLFQTKARKTYKSNLLIFISCRLVNPDGSPFRQRESNGIPSFKY